MESLELKVPPVALVLTCAALMWLVSLSTERLRVRVPFQRGLSGCAAVAGAFLPTFIIYMNLFQIRPERTRSRLDLW
jgi:hypothetical protein